jgi:hypothetical protein
VIIPVPIMSNGGKPGGARPNGGRDQGAQALQQDAAPEAGHRMSTPAPRPKRQHAATRLRQDEPALPPDRPPPGFPPSLPSDRWVRWWFRCRRLRRSIERPTTWILLIGLPLSAIYSRFSTGSASYHGLGSGVFEFLQDSGDLIFTAVAAGYVFVIIGYRRSITRQTRDVELYKIARSVVRRLSIDLDERHAQRHAIEDTSTSRVIHHDHGDGSKPSKISDHVGVRIWRVAGFWRFQHLALVAADIPERKLGPAPFWPKYKSIVGTCWAEPQNRVYKNYPRLERREFSELPLWDDRRQYLDWSEYERRSVFKTIWVVPFITFRNGYAQFLGCLTFDVSREGYHDDVECLKDTPKTELESLFAACRATLEGGDADAAIVN